MPNYRRLQIPASTWFFTVNLLQRHNNNLLIEEIKTLKACIQKVHNSVVDWPYSTFHNYVKAGIYPANWCGEGNVKIVTGE